MIAMGGIGSGRRWGFGSPTCDSQFAIDIRRLARNGWLKPGVAGLLSWRRRGEVVGSVRYASEEGSLSLFYDQPVVGGGQERCAERIAFVWTACHLGGERVWFRCPGCGTRMAILYYRTGRFRCRQCCGLAYLSQRKRPPERALRRAQNIRMRLGGVADLTAPFPDRPRYMRHRKYDHLRMVAEASEAAWLRSMSCWVDRFGEQIRR